jgi:hypothetical protein
VLPMRRRYRITLAPDDMEYSSTVHTIAEAVQWYRPPKEYHSTPHHKSEGSTRILWHLEGIEYPSTVHAIVEAVLWYHPPPVDGVP